MYKKIKNSTLVRFFIITFLILLALYNQEFADFLPTLLIIFKIVK